MNNSFDVAQSQTIYRLIQNNFAAGNVTSKPRGDLVKIIMKNGFSYNDTKQSLVYLELNGKIEVKVSLGMLIVSLPGGVQ